LETRQKQIYATYQANKRRNNPLYDLILCLKAIFKAPGIMVITGEWKSGKTDFGLWVAIDILLKLGIVSKVGSNIKVQDKRCDYVADNETLHYWLHRDSSNKIYIFDEAIKHAYKRTPMSRTQIGLIQVITELSKGHGRGIVIAQDPTMVDKDLLNPIWCRCLVVKGGFSRRTEIRLTTFPNWLIPGGGLREFTGVPRTSVNFDPYEEAEYGDRAEDATFLQNPEIVVFMRYVRGESSEKLRADQDVLKALDKTHMTPTDILRIVRRVGRAFLSSYQPKAVEVNKALEKDTETP
jgi:hypothetical protein